MNKEQAQSRITAIENELAELKKVINEPEKVVRYEWLKYEWTYYMISGDGSISRYRHDGNDFDLRLLSIGNVYQTEAEAQHEVDRRKLIEEMKNDSTDLRGEYSIYYNTWSHKWLTTNIVVVVQFATQQEAQQALTKYADRLHLLLPYGFNTKN